MYLASQSSTPTANLENKWESAKLMDKYHVVGITAILYSRCAMIINIVSKEEKSYPFKICDYPHCTCLNFTKMSLQGLRKNENGCIANTFTMCSCFYARRINDKFPYPPTYTFNKFINTWACWYCRTQVVMSVEYPFHCFEMLVYDMKCIVFTLVPSNNDLIIRTKSSYIIYINHGNRPHLFVYLQSVLSTI